MTEEGGDSNDIRSSYDEIDEEDEITLQGTSFSLYYSGTFMPAKNAAPQTSMKEIVAILSGDLELPPLPVEYSPSPPSHFRSHRKARSGLNDKHLLNLTSCFQLKFKSSFQVDMTLQDGRSFEGTCLMYTTDGLLLRETLKDKNLDNYSWYVDANMTRHDGTYCQPRWFLSSKSC
ncbi:hypothetical protein Tco_0987731 [Tanacetum coccineum]